VGTQSGAGEQTVTEFFAMGGYAFYVWSSFGLTFLVMAAIVLNSMLQRKRAIALVKRKAQLKPNSDPVTGK
jgi:heme exporter protein D